MLEKRASTLHIENVIGLVRGQHFDIGLFYEESKRPKTVASLRQSLLRAFRTSSTHGLSHHFLIFPYRLLAHHYRLSTNVLQLLHVSPVPPSISATFSTQPAQQQSQSNRKEPKYIFIFTQLFTINHHPFVGILRMLVYQLKMNEVKWTKYD